MLFKNKVVVYMYLDNIVVKRFIKESLIYDIYFEIVSLFRVSGWGNCATFTRYYII